MSATFISRRRVAASGFVAIILFLFFASSASANMDVQFPVAELGNCGSKEECYAYCEVPDNVGACLTFAEKNKLMDEKEISEARKFVAAGSKGPGGCTGKKSCEQYCNNITHISECLSFAEKTGMMSGEELEEARKIVAYLDKGGKLPGGCSNQEECDAYCGSSNPAKMKECINFAMSAGFMSEKEAKEIDKVLTALDKGVPPPKCRGDEECAVYCSQEENVEECAAFMLASGMMTEREVEFLRKTGGRGPGGCVGKACETFCDDPANRDVCTTYALENGFISKDDYEGRGRFKKDFETMPASIQSCLRNSIGAEFDKLLADNPPSPEAREKMNSCFELMRPSPDDFPRSGGEGSPYPGGPAMNGSSSGGYGPTPGDYRDGQPGEGFARPANDFVPPMNAPLPDDGSFTAPSSDSVRP